MKNTNTNITKNFNEILKTDYDRLLEMKGKLVKLEREKDSLVDLANERYDFINALQDTLRQYASDPKRENLANEIIKLKTENQKLESEIKELKTHLRLISNLSNYEKLGYKK